MHRGRLAANRNDLSVFDMSQDSEPSRCTVFEESQDGAPVGRSNKTGKQHSEKVPQEKGARGGSLFLRVNSAIYLHAVPDA